MALKSTCLVIIIDGLGDLPNPKLDSQTPLEAASTPAMDRLAGSGRYGLVDPIAQGIIPNTHSGTGLLMGMLPEQERLLSRGPVEAAGAGLPLNEGDVAFRANFATVDSKSDGLHIVDRRAGRILKNTAKLASALDGMDLGDGVTVRLQSTDQHRCVLVLQGNGLDARVSRTDPGDGGLPAMVWRCEAQDPAAFFTASKVQQFSIRAHEILNAHPVNEARRRKGELPANAIITRGAGVAFRLESESSKRQVPTAVVAGCNTVLGLARLFGFEPVTDERFTADIETDVGAKLNTAVRALDRYPLVFVHFKAPDILSHDCDPHGKRDFIERIDREIQQLGNLSHGLLVTADHSTDSSTGAHTEDPVPVLYYRPGDSGALESRSVNFSELACSSGNLARRTGYEMLREVIQFIA